MTERGDVPPIDALRAANARFVAAHPGESSAAQPSHAVIGGAHLFTGNTLTQLQGDALAALERFGADPVTFGRAVGMAGTDTAPPPDRGGWLAQAVYARMLARLRTEAVEDYRIDFEDGFGIRSDTEEDAEARRTALVLSELLAAGRMCRRYGIRVRPLTEELRERSVRTLRLFTEELMRGCRGTLPGGYVVTLAKVTVAEQVAYFADVLTTLEHELGLPDESLRFEIMIEVPQAILGDDGRSPLPRFREMARGRLVAAHIGTYDYTAGCGITAMHQHMRHSACEFARHMLQAAYASTGVWIADGSTAVLPVPPHTEAVLSSTQQRENVAAVHAAWRQHFDDVTHSLANGFYQGWDLHGAQLPTRYAALYAFFLSGLGRATDRLRTFLGTLTGAEGARAIADDAATGQALLNFVLRAVHCGAVDEEDAVEMTGLTLAELRGRSFVHVLEARLQGGSAPAPGGSA